MSDLARSSIRFSRNERLLDLARNVRLFSTSAMSAIEPLRILSELSLKRPFQFVMVVDLAVAELAEQPLDLVVVDGAPQADVVDVGHRHEHRRVVRENPQMKKPARRAEDGLLFDLLYDAETVIGVDDLVADLE